MATLKKTTAKKQKKPSLPVRVKSKNNSSVKKNIPVALILALKAKGLTNEQVAVQLGCHKSNVTYHLTHVGYVHNGDEAYQQSRAKIERLKQSRLVTKQFTFLDSNHSKIGDWSDYQRSEISKGISQDKEFAADGRIPATPDEDLRDVQKQLIQNNIQINMYMQELGDLIPVNSADKEDDNCQRTLSASVQAED